MPPPRALAALWSTHRDRAWVFVRPGGNWGDQLIYAGADSLARRLGLSWVDRDWANFEPGQVPRGAGVYLHGGGGLNHWSSGRAFRILHQALTIPDALVIQGPQTCDTTPRTAALLADTLAGARAAEVHLCAREPTSAAFLAAHLPDGITLHTDHDTAFHLSPAEVLGLAGLAEVPAGRYTLLVAREDVEAAARPPGAPRDAVRLDPASHAVSFAHWLRLHAWARCIVSNRLHSAIAGVLFGKPTVLGGGSYHKNRSVWDYSLRDRGVAWADEATGAPEPAPTGLRLPRLLAQSWKVQRALLWLRGVPPT